MFRSRTMLFVEMGDHNLKLLEARGAPGGYEVLRAALAKVPDEVRRGTAAQKAQFLRRTLDEHGLASRRTVAVLPRHLAILRQVELPPGSPEELHKMIRFQAEKEMPLPLDQMRFAYKVASQSERGNTLATLIGVQKDVIDAHSGILASAGLNAAAVCLSSLGLYNRYMETHHGSRDDTTAIVDIGAAMTEFAIVKAGRLTFTRSADFGAEGLTTLAKEEERIPLEDAEMRKRAIGYPDSFPAWASLWTGEAVSEIDRTLKSYAGYAHGDRVQRIVLTGGGARLRGLGNLISERLALPVEAPSPLEEQDSSLDPSFSVIRGVAAGYFNQTRFAFVDLLHPTESLRAKSPPKSAIAIACAIVGAALLSVVIPYATILTKRSDNATIASRRKELEADSQRLKNVREHLRFVSAWFDHRPPMEDLLFEITNAIPDDKPVFLASLTVEQNGSVRITGKARATENVTAFIKGLEASPMFGSVTFNFVRTAAESRTHPFDFAITATAIFLHARTD